MQCPSCSRESSPDAAFCAACGARLAAVCSSCGRTNAGDAAFCEGCGQSLGGAEPVGVPTVEPAPTPPSPISFASGRYRVESFLGEGAKKRVYLAHDTRLDRDIAIGVIKVDGLDAPGRQRVEREARAMGRLGEHSHIVNIYDVADEGGDLFVVSQYVAGGTLESGLADAPERRLPFEEVLRIGDELCQALEHTHVAGVVHRDIKPGNIYLATDGSAKLGDFGLARAAHESKMTTEGSMLGTVAYMPPEQALGNEASPQSDLYSLGAVLYEMVTGRPPFVGDDAVGVISQHLNQAPVAPSWHRDDCPRDLEDLILALLAKAESDRPESAQALRERLAEIDLTTAVVPTQRGNPLERLARGVFVGRESEVSALRSAYDSALGGHGELVMLVGEPGIGKTRTTIELDTYARMRGAQVLWGRNHESSGAPAYHPWVQVGRAWGNANDQSQLPPSARATGELIHLFPELREILPDLPEPEQIGDAQAAQFRLFDAYTEFLRGAAELTPLVVVLDDLHWADKPSLLLLQHFARELDRMRVLVVATFRDTELARTHPLSETLADLNREAGFRRIVLRGLSQDEVATYIHSVSNVDPAPAVLQRIYEETEGNPFFLSEIVNLMAQEGTLEATSLSDVAIPDGVREALGRRLDRISEEGNELLATAAVIGRDFPYATLALVGEHDEATLLRLIEEALDARVIEEMEAPGRYRFTHALMQETLLSELSTTRRIHLHGRIAEALEERWGDRAEERASLLARHFVEASTVTERHTEKAIHYSRLAAEQAQSQAGWAEATQRYQDCLMLTDPSQTPPQQRAELLIALGACARNAGEYRIAWRSLLEAADLCGEENPEGLARAVLETLWISADQSRQLAIVDRALAALGDAHPGLETRLLLGRSRWVSGADSAESVERAKHLVREHGLDDLRAELASCEARLLLIEGRGGDALELFRSAFRGFEAAQDWAGAGQVLLPLGTQPFSYFEDVDQAADEARWALDRLKKYRVDFAMQNVGVRLTGLELARCDFEQFQALAEENRLDNYAYDLQRVAYHEWRGDPQRAISLIPSVSRAGNVPDFVMERSAGAARVLFNAGQTEAARREIEIALDIWSRSSEGVLGQGLTWMLAELDEALPDLLKEDELQALYDSGEATGIFWDPMLYRSYSRLRGGLALALDRLEEAEAEFSRALEWTSEQGIWVEVGRCHQGLAEIAERRGEKDVAVRHLDQAIELFQRYGLRHFLDQSLAAKMRIQNVVGQGSIHAVASSVEVARPDLSSHAAPDGTVTLMFSDMEDYTGMLERLGDLAAHELVQEHNAIVREQVQAHGGHEVELRGDGFLLAFASARQAVLCAIALQRAFLAHSSANPERAIRVRIGLHTGETIKDADKFFGKSVVQAFRVADLAQGGEILLSSLTRDLVASAGDLAMDEGREVELKGLEGTHRVFAVRWE